MGKTASILSVIVIALTVFSTLHIVLSPILKTDRKIAECVDSEDVKKTFADNRFVSFNTTGYETSHEFCKEFVSGKISKEKLQLQKTELEKDMKKKIDKERISKLANIRYIDKRYLESFNIEATGIMRATTPITFPNFETWNSELDVSWNGSGTLLVYITSKPDDKNRIGTPQLVLDYLSLENRNSFDIVLYSKNPLAGEFIESKLVSNEGTVVMNGKTIENLYVYSLE